MSDTGNGGVCSVISGILYWHMKNAAMLMFKKSPSSTVDHLMKSSAQNFIAFKRKIVEHYLDF